MNRRNDVRDVAHVCAPRTHPIIAFAGRAPESLQMTAEKARKGHVVDHVAVAVPSGYLDGDVARHRRCARASLDDRANALELTAIEGSNAELARRVLRDDVDRLTAVGDKAVDANAVPEVDALAIDQSERVEAGGQSAAPCVGGKGGVRGRPAEVQRQPEGSERRVRQQVAVEWVEHHRRIDAVEGPGPDHFDLASPSLLGRRSKKHHLPPVRVGNGRGRDERAHGAGSDEIVPAGVPHPRKRVVFRKNGDAWPPAASRASAQGGRHACNAALDFMPALFEKLADPAARLVLFEAQLGVVVDATGEGHQIVRAVVHHAIDRRLDFGGERHRQRFSPDFSPSAGRRAAIRQPWRGGDRPLPSTNRMIRSAALAILIAVGAGCRDSSSSQPGTAATPVSAQAPPSDTPEAGEAAILAPFVPEKVTSEGRAMGTHLAYAAFTTPEVDSAHAQAAFDAATTEIKRLEALMTTWNPNSEVSRVNAAAGKEPVEVGVETFDVIRESLHASEMSGGAFDITFETLHGLWKFDEDLDPHPPSAADVRARRRYLGYGHVKLDAARRTVLLDEAHVRIGLGGIAKGYAVDRASRILLDAGLRSFYVQAGGDLYAHGSKPDGSLWIAGIRDPRGNEGDYFAMMALGDHAFSTAGDYERAYIVGGTRYHHIIDPHTGYPATASRSVTIWAPTALLADEIDDAVFILGPAKGLALVESLDGVGAVIVDSRNKVWTSKRLEGQLHDVHPPTDAL
jgi:thiamine biosynthesis lipoprotein